MSEAEEAQIRFLFRAGRVCGQLWCSELTLNKYFTYAQLKSYRLGRERETEEEGEKRRERRYSSESNKMGNLMSLFSEEKSVVTVLECDAIYNSILKSNTVIVILIFAVSELLKLSG